MSSGTVWVKFENGTVRVIEKPAGVKVLVTIVRSEQEETTSIHPTLDVIENGNLKGEEEMATDETRSYGPNYSARTRRDD
jgi:hypothetical protein